jgi:hypothetical protein
VIDAATQRPVSDVQVLIEGTTLGALTNVSGEFAVAGVPAGERTLRVRRIGFRPRRAPSR